MRALYLLVAVVACSKAEPPSQVAPTTAPPTSPPVPAPVTPDAGAAAAPVAHVDLLRAVASTVRVSSTVANKAIVPWHIVDQNLKTAWNSATGDVIGAWVEIQVAAGSTIRELRLTAGSISAGPKGQDYFLMNPRIKHLRVVVDGKPAVTLELEVRRRDLQTFAVTATTKLRLEVAEVVAGTKKQWREASISELEVWGTPPPGWQAPAKPTLPRVEVAAPAARALDPDDPCAEINATREAFIERHKNDVHEGPGADDHDYPPACADFPVGSVADLPAPWSDAKSWCEINDEVYGPRDCTLRFAHAGETAELTAEHAAAQSEIAASVSLRDVIPGGAQELVARFKSYEGESIAVCRAKPLSCTARIIVAADRWTVRESFDKGELVLAAGTGSPPTGVIGRHPLVFK